MTRLEANKILVEILSAYIQQYPDIRFGQALFNLGLIQRKPDSLDIEDPFYEESTKTLSRFIYEPGNIVVPQSLPSGELLDSKGMGADSDKTE